ncbi:MAG: RusA family crossover junction endodeoxyribonuclease [Pseudobdellovibrionaceae bacterium]
MSEKLLFRCLIPGRVAIKKNGTQRKYSWKHKRAYTAPSDRYEKWAEDAAIYVKDARNRFKITAPLTGLLHVKFTFCFENRQWEPDLSNCYEGPQDVMQEAGVFEDDQLIHSHDGSRKIFGVKPCVIIELYEYKEDVSSLKAIVEHLQTSFSR